MEDHDSEGKYLRVKFEKYVDPIANIATKIAKSRKAEITDGPPRWDRDIDFSHLLSVDCFSMDSPPFAAISSSR